MEATPKVTYADIFKAYENGERGTRRKTIAPNKEVNLFLQGYRYDNIPGKIGCMLERSRNLYLWVLGQKIEQNRKEIEQMLEQIFSKDNCKKFVKINKTDTTEEIEVDLDFKVFYMIVGMDTRPLKNKILKAMADVARDAFLSSYENMFHDDHVREVEEDEKDCIENIKEIIDAINKEIAERLIPSEGEIKDAVRYGEFATFYYKRIYHEDYSVTKVYDTDGYLYDKYITTYGV